MTEVEDEGVGVSENVWGMAMHVSEQMPRGERERYGIKGLRWLSYGGYGLLYYRCADWQKGSGSMPLGWHETPKVTEKLIP